MRYRTIPIIHHCFRRSFRLGAQLCCCVLLAVISGCSESSTGDDFPAGSVRETAFPGKPFTVALRFDSANDCNLHYHWQDFRGEALTAPAPLPLNKNTTIRSFPGIGGYLGLVLTTDCPDLDD